MNSQSTPKLRHFTPLAVAAAVLLSACSIADEGPAATQVRDVKPFVRVANDSSVDLRLRAGGRRHVRVRAGRNVIDTVGTEVRDGTLLVTFDRDGLGDSHVEVDVTVPSLEGIESDGSGDIRAVGIDGGPLEVWSDGSGDIAVAGEADRVSVRSDGSGTVDLADLAARDANIASDGSGDVAVRAGRRLDVRLDGSGDVRYLGDPQLTQSDDGSGEIEHVD